MLLEENCETWHHLLKQAIHVLGKNVVVVDMADRSIYIGNTVSNSAQGDGVCFWPPDDPGGRREYAGHFVGGLRHGKGVMLFTDGTVYKGEWEKNAPNGFGQEFYPDGSSYKGRFHKDSRQGAGTYVTADKAAYPGIWRQGAWEKTLEPEAQAQLDEAMSRATTACDDAAQLNERLKICRSLRKHAPLHYRGPLLSILEAHNSAKADTEKAQEDEAAEEAAEEAICAQNTLLNSLISPRNKSLLQAVVQAPSVPSSDERQCASDLERQRLPDAHETMRLKKSGQVQLSKLRADENFQENVLVGADQTGRSATPRVHTPRNVSFSMT